MVFQVIHDLGVVCYVLSCCYCYSFSCFSFSVFGYPWCVAFQVRGGGLLLVSVSVITWLLVRFATACRLLIFPSMPLVLAYSIFKVSPSFFLFIFLFSWFSVFWHCKVCILGLCCSLGWRWPLILQFGGAWWSFSVRWSLLFWIGWGSWLAPCCHCLVVHIGAGVSLFWFLLCLALWGPLWAP